MSTNIDLAQLAIDRPRGAMHPLVHRRHLLTRYVLPATLLLGFAALLTWGLRDWAFPPQRVMVVPVMATRSAAQQAGTPLFRAAGWVEPRPTPLRVAALAPGVVEKLLVVEDQEVHAGDIVAELVTADANLAVRRSHADLDLAKADFEKAEANVRAATTRLEQPVHLQSAVAQADADLAELAKERNNLPFELRRARAQLDYAQQNYDNKVAAKDGIAERLLLEAKSELAVAQATVEELHSRDTSLVAQHKAITARRDALGKQLELLVDERQAKDASTAEARAAEARLEQTRVASAQAELQLQRMTVRAPSDGRVYQLVSAPGTTLAGNMPTANSTDTSTVITMYRPDMLQVRVDVRFEDLPKISRGQEVRIDNPALASPLRGEVLFISSEADIQKNTLQVKVAINSPPPVFKPEMLVDVTFLAPESAADEADAKETWRLFVPRDLVKQDDAGSFLWVADLSAGIARRTRVKVASNDLGDMVEVTSGLTMTSRLIADGHDALRDGQRIEVIGDEPRAAPMSHDHEPANRSRLPEGEHH